MDLKIISQACVPVFKKILFLQKFFITITYQERLREMDL
jgi:hypothetical protein